MSLTAEQLATLRALHAKATPGPWASDHEIKGWWGGEQPACRVSHELESTKNMLEPVCMCPSSPWPIENQPIADADLIAFLRNVVPQLLGEGQVMRADWEPSSPAGYVLTVLLLCGAVYGSLLIVFTFGG